MSEENKVPAALTAGSTAPDFTLQARSGKTISLHDFAGQKDVLIYFYPKDDTPGCTRESCSLRDGWADLGKAGIEVLGISRDDAASHNAFATKYNLPFELLTDADHAVHEKYGAWGQNPNPAWGVGPLRKSFLVGKDGTVKQVFDKVDTERHADQVLRAAGFTPAPKPAPAPAVAPAPKPAAPTVSSVAEAARTAVASAVSKVAEKVEKAAAAVEKAAIETAAPAAPRIAAAKKAVKTAVKKVVRKAKKAVAKAKASKPARKAKVKKAARKVKKAARKVKKAVAKARVKKAAKRTVRRTARKAVRKVKRAVRKAKKPAPKRKARKTATRKKR